MRLLTFLSVVAAACCCAAFDNTISNEYWCTWGYVNATTNAQSGTTAVAVASVLPDVELSSVPAEFSTFPDGFMILVR